MDSEQVLRSAWTGACTRFPELRLAFDAYAAHVRGVLGGGDEAVLPKLALEDLFLACACLRGDDAALRRFDRDVLGACDAAVRGLDNTDSFLDEVKQRLRTKLLAGDTEQPPRIGEFAGRGALVAWVTVAAVRTGLSLLRERKRAERFTGDGWAEALALPDVGDVEVDYVK
ncbi:MAG: hypothetical protein IPN32_14125 [Deltaproteobacteria bacterium]|nr:hypothetical protein [Deltaproteobacteria bacterium]